MRCPIASKFASFGTTSLPSKQTVETIYVSVEARLVPTCKKTGLHWMSKQTRLLTVQAASQTLEGWHSSS